jgi:multidrug efflux pump subunit AcrA (membrane-fusion protein)
MPTEIDLDNSGKKLREGMHGVVTIVLSDSRPGLTIPMTAVVWPVGGHLTCFRIVNGQAVRTPIQLGPNDGNRALVLDGLNEGDLAVVDPRADGMKHGEPVAADER